MYKKFPQLNPEDQEKLDELRTKMCELDELRSLLVLLIRTYNPKISLQGIPAGKGFIYLDLI